MREGLVSVNYQPDARLIDYACLPINAGKSRVLRDALALLRDSVGHEPLAADLTQENIDRAFPLGCCKKNDIRLNRLHAVIELAGWLGVQIDKPKVTARARTEHEMIEQVDGQLALAGLFRQYYRPKRLLGKSQNTTRLYEITIRKFCRWLGRPAMLSDLTDETVGSYVQWLLDESGNAGHTIEKEATQLLVLWRYASRRQMGPAWPEIRPPEPPEVSPDAFTREELSALIEACRTQQGLICGMPAGIWWEALVSVIFDSGERVGAVLSVQWSDLSGEWLTVPAKYRKGKRKPGRYRLRAGTLALLQEMRAHSEEPVIFAWHMSRGYVWQRFSKIVKQAGIEDKRRNKFHKIRRTVATFFEQAGGDATRLLQHNSRKTTEAYLDESMIQRTQAVDLIEAIT
jgi:integrase